MRESDRERERERERDEWSVSFNKNPTFREIMSSLRPKFTETIFEDLIVGAAYLLILYNTSERECEKRAIKTKTERE